MKQMPVESRFAYVGIPSRLAIARTSRFVIAPSGNSTGASCACVSRCRKYVWSFDASTALRQLDGARRARPMHARVMSGCDAVGAERQRMVEERAELDLAVAQHVRIGRPARRVIAQEMREHALAVLGREIDRFELDADDVGHRRGIDEVFARRAVFIGIVVFPVFHEKTDDVIALLLEQPGGHGRIDAAGHADDDALTALHQRLAMRPSGQRRPAR